MPSARPTTQAWQQHRAGNRADTDTGQHDAVAARAKAEFTTRHQRQQCPARAAKQKLTDIRDGGFHTLARDIHEKHGSRKGSMNRRRRQEPASQKERQLSLF